MNEQEKQELQAELEEAFEATGWENDAPLSMPVNVGDTLTFTGDFTTINSTVDENGETKAICYSVALTKEGKNVTFRHIARVANGLPIESIKRKERVFEFLAAIREGSIKDTYTVLNFVPRPIKNKEPQMFIQFA